MALSESDLKTIIESGAISSLEIDIQKLTKVNNPIFTEKFLPGEDICRNGDHADRMWIVLEGSLEIYGKSADQDIRLPVTRNVGEIVGEQGLLDEDTTRKATVRAGTFTRVATIPRDAIISLNDQKLREKIWLNLARILSGKLSQATSHRTKLITQGQQSREVLGLFTTEYSRRNVEQYLDGEDPYRRVEAVFWFSDIVGFSVLADSLEPADSAKLIRSVMELQARAIDNHDGFVDKFMGDGLMAFWPKQTSWEATCRKAFDAALMFKDGFPAEKLPNTASQIDLRIGLHCGQAIYGNYGAKGLIAQTFLGTDVNRAARCEQAKADENDAPLTSYRIRATDTFREKLSPTLREKIPNKHTARVKHDETFIIWCC